MEKQRLTPLGVEVKKRLIEMQRTQVWLAAEVGTSKRYLGHILTGYRSGESYIPKIKQVLGLDEETA